MGPMEVGGGSHFHSKYDGVFSVTAKSIAIEACSTSFLETRSETVTEPEHSVHKIDFFIILAHRKHIKLPKQIYCFL